MSTLMYQLLLSSLTVWLLWRLVAIVFAKSDSDNISGPEMDSFLGGNLGEFFDPDSWDWHARMSNKFGRVVRLWGLFGTKELWISDPLALYHILIKDMHSFEEPEWNLESHRITLGSGVLAVAGTRHKKHRKMLNPVFSTTHIKHMVPLFYQVVHKVRDAICKKVVNQPQELDMLLWVSRTALELIGTAGLGYSFETFDEHTPPSLYTQAVKEFMPTLNDLGIFLRFLHLTKGLVSDKMSRKLVQMIPSKKMRKMLSMVDLMDSTSRKVLEKKKRALNSGDEATVKQIGEGKDIISILVKANQDATPEDRFSEDEVLGQMSTLIFAAFDTTSSGLSRILYLLSRHPDVQEMLRAEVSAALHNGDIPFDDLVSLPYLDAVCRETLRLYPPVPMLLRETLQDSVLPLSRPIIGVDGKEMSSIHIPKGTDIIIGLMECNRDKLIWGEDALEWKPDRWLKPLPESVVAARVPGVYANLMTFSGGKRSCIGFKFSELEMKVVLAVISRSFVFEPAKDKEIVFNMGGVVWPRVLDGSGKPELPMRVSLAKPI